MGLLAIGLGAVPAPAELPGAALGTGQPLVQQAGSRQVPAWGGEALLSPQRPAGLGLGGPQQPPALTGGKTDGRGCIFSCSHPTHGHQLTGMGWGGNPRPRAQPSCPGVFLGDTAMCGVPVAWAAVVEDGALGDMGRGGAAGIGGGSAWGRGSA